MKFVFCLVLFLALIGTVVAAIKLIIIGIGLILLSFLFLALLSALLQ